MHARRTHLLAFALALGMLVHPIWLHAWTEARPAGLVTEVSVDRDGGAVVTLRIRWRILAGRLQQFDLAEVPSDLTILEASAITSTGVPVALSTRIPAPGRLEVSLGDDSGGVRRGAVDVVIRYTTSLRAQGAIRRAGTDAVIEVSTTPWERGLEAAEIRLAVPTSERRAQWISDDTPGIDATTTTEPARDIVHALRRHLPAGTRWTARVAVDPNLFPWLSTGALRAPQVIRRAPSHTRSTTLYAAALVCVLLFAARRLTRSVRRAAWLPGRFAAVPTMLVIAAGCLQAGASSGLAPGLALGTFALLLALALRVPSPRPVVAVDPTAPVRPLSGREVVALAPRRSTTPFVLAALAVLAGMLAFAGIRTAGIPGMILGTAAVDLAVGIVAWLLLHRPDIIADASLLPHLAQRVDRVLAPLGCARIGWTLQGDVSQAGALRARLVPRTGWRFARGVHAIEWSVAQRPATLVWHPCVVAIVRVSVESDVAASLQSLATRVGVVQASPDGAQIAYVAELLGPDRAAFFRALVSLCGELFVKSPDAVMRAQPQVAVP